MTNKKSKIEPKGNPEVEQHAETASRCSCAPGNKECCGNCAGHSATGTMDKLKQLCPCCNGTGVQFSSDMLKVLCPACGGVGMLELPKFPEQNPVSPWPLVPKLPHPEWTCGYSEVPGDSVTKAAFYVLEDGKLKRIG